MNKITWVNKHRSWEEMGQRIGLRREVGPEENDRKTLGIGKGYELWDGAAEARSRGVKCCQVIRLIGWGKEWKRVGFWCGRRRSGAGVEKGIDCSCRLKRIGEMRGRSYSPSPPRYSRRGGGRSPSPRGRYPPRPRQQDLPTSLLVRNLRHDCRRVSFPFFSIFTFFLEF